MWVFVLVVLGLIGLYVVVIWLLNWTVRLGDLFVMGVWGLGLVLVVFSWLVWCLLSL